MAPKLAEPTIEELDAGKIIAGPFCQFGNSFVIEYIEPPAFLNATILLRATYVNPAVNPINKTGKKHPQSPPLHIHFDQWESFMVAKGKVCTTKGWDAIDSVHVKQDGVHHVAPWEPHSFYPCADATEDTTIYLWAHPEAVPDPMDRLFFQTLLGFLSDVYEKKEPMSILQIMTNGEVPIPSYLSLPSLVQSANVGTFRHASATALVMFPRTWWLGPLRWWIPWHLQGLAAIVGRWCGYKGLMEKYMTAEEWASYIDLHSKRT